MNEWQLTTEIKHQSGWFHLALQYHQLYVKVRTFLGWSFFGGDKVIKYKIL